MRLAARPFLGGGLFTLSLSHPSIERVLFTFFLTRAVSERRLPDRHIPGAHGVFRAEVTRCIPLSAAPLHASLWARWGEELRPRESYETCGERK